MNFSSIYSHFDSSTGNDALSMYVSSFTYGSFSDKLMVKDAYDDLNLNNLSEPSEDSWNMDLLKVNNSNDNAISNLNTIAISDS